MAGASQVAAEPREIEVKLGVAEPRVIRGLLKAPDGVFPTGFRAAGPVHVVTVTDRYLDTDPMAGSLFLAGIRARLRRELAVTTLTVKRSGVLERGVSTRVELHGAATRSIDPRNWPASAARTVLLDAAGSETLRVIAQLRQRRLTRLVGRGTTVVELSLDALEAVGLEGVIARRNELEAELKAGDETALAELGEALLLLDGIGPPLGSKLRFALESAGVPVPLAR